MNVLLISPVLTPITPDSRYVGIERMVWSYAKELIKNHKVTVIGHSLSVFPKGVELLPVGTPSVYHDLELKAHQMYSHLFRSFDVIHDWSHFHLASRFIPNLPSLNIFFHAPSLAKYPKAPYNIIALSEWAKIEFRRVYKQDAKYQYSIGIDPKVYKLSQRHRGNRLLTIGRMHQGKGNLDALMVAKDAGYPIDVAGGRGFESDSSDPLTLYETTVRSKCDGKINKFYGEVTEERKIKLMQDCRALIYLPPPEHPEVTSHKIQEAMFTGAPIITCDMGALPEIVTDKVNGFVCVRIDGFLDAIRRVEELDIKGSYAETVERFCIENVVKNYIPLYESVANGERWG